MFGGASKKTSRHGRKRFVGWWISVSNTNANVHGATLIIFVDESGRFIPGDGWSVVCALSLPHTLVGQARRQLAFETRSWPRKNGELKGSLVTVENFTTLVDCLFRNRAILHCCAMDVAGHDLSEIDAHKASQADAMTRHLTSEHNASLVANVWELRRILEGMSNQLYVQSVLMRELVCIVADETASYFAQRNPRELGKYEWFIDAKDIRETKQEKWWRDVLGPLVESRSERIPFLKVRSPAFDYRFLDRAYAFDKDKWRPNVERVRVSGVDIMKMFTRATRFVDSKSDILIQAVDILASYCRKSLRLNKVDPELLRQVGRLQIRRSREGVRQSMNLLSIGSNLDVKNRRLLGKRMAIMTEASRGMFLPSSRD